MTKPIGEYLVEAGLLEPIQVEAVLAEQRVTGRRFGDIVVARGWLQRQTIEYWMERVIIPHRQAMAQRHKSVPRSKPPEETLLIGTEAVSVPPQPLPQMTDAQHQETLILEWKDLPPP